MFSGQRFRRREVFILVPVVDSMFQSRVVSRWPEHGDV